MTSAFGINYVCATCKQVNFFRKCEGHEFTDPPAPVDPRDEQIALLTKKLKVAVKALKSIADGTEEHPLPVAEYALCIISDLDWADIKVED